MADPQAPTSSAPKLPTETLTLKRNKARRHHGFLRMKIFLDKKTSNLTCHVFEARDLIALDKRGTSDPYVKAYLLPDPSKKTKQKTAPKKKTLNPWWDETLTWPLLNFPEHHNRILQVTVWDKGALAKNDFLGRTSVVLSEVLPPRQGLEGWFELFDPERGKHEFAVADPPNPNTLHIALYNYTPAAKSHAELYLREGDLVKLKKEEGDWSLVQNPITKTEGYIPASFIAPSISLDEEPWFFGKISRTKAEKLLSSLLCKHGCFLIRESESRSGTYSLSMKDGEEARHYRIDTIDNAYRLQGAPTEIFGTLGQLVEWHSKRKDGLTTVLREPCIKEQPARAPDLSYEQRDKWEVDRDAIELVGNLGIGQYGEVYQGLWNGTVEVAVKTLKSRSSCAKDFLEEAAIMKKLKHPNLIQLHAVCTIGEPIYIIIELMSNGALLDYLKKEAGASLRLPTLIDMASDIASGMEYLEMNNFIHRDLAARNVLVGENNICKVADFGFARLVEGEQYSSKIAEKFPVRWTAPEAMLNKASIKSDVWSFGITLAEIVTYGKKPYDGLTNKEVVQQLEDGYRMAQPIGCPDGVYKIMLDCWKQDPAERPTFQSLVHRLEDFFHSSEANYTDLKNLMAQAKDQGISIGQPAST